MAEILIIGGGIAGLSAAMLLQREHTVHLVEKQPSWQISGTGLYTPGNGVAALQKMGLYEMARSAGAVINTRHITNAQGTTGLRISLERVWGRPDPCLGIGRRQLHQILLERVDRARISLGMTADRISPGAAHVEVTFSDGSTGRFDVVIGSDGLYSQTRDLVIGPVPFRTVYPRVCRFVVPNTTGIRDWTLRVGRKGHIAMIPIGKDELYCYVNNTTGAHLSKDEYMPPFFKFASPVPEVLDHWDPETSHWDKVDELAPLDRYGSGRLVLIGDAAHGMPPLMAQGGSLAMEDALVLARLMREHQDHTTLAAAFTTSRKARVEWTRARNHRREKLGRLPAWLAAIGVRLMGTKPWIADYKPLATTPDW